MVILCGEIERKLLSTFEHNDLGDLLKDGGTETFHYEDLEKIISLIETELHSKSEDLPNQT